MVYYTYKMASLAPFAASRGDYEHNLRHRWNEAAGHAESLHYLHTLKGAS